MTQTKIKVGLDDRAYDITIGPELIDQAGSLLGEIAAGRHIIIISDDHVAPLHMQRLCDSLSPVTHRHQRQSVIPIGQCQWPEYHRAIVPAPPLICWIHLPAQRTDRAGASLATSYRKAAAYAKVQHDHHL